MVGCLSSCDRRVGRIKTSLSEMGCVTGFASGLKALVVDDNPIVLQCTAKMLEKLGFEIQMAHQGAEALAYLKRSSCDFILTDYEMPVIDGYQLGRKAKSFSPGTRIVVMTGHCQAAVAQMMRDHHIDGWLFKPFRMQDLMEMLALIGFPISPAYCGN